VFVALWGFMNEEGLLFEMKYGVFDGGRMVAWGRLLLVDGLVVPLTSVEEDLVGLPMGVVERSV